MTGYNPLECPILLPEVREQMLLGGWAGTRITGFGVQLDAQVYWDSLSVDEKARFIDHATRLSQGGR